MCNRNERCDMWYDFKWYKCTIYKDYFSFLMKAFDSFEEDKEYDEEGFLKGEG